MEAQPEIAPELKITIHARLHLTLLAMHDSEYRINGGIGFAVTDPTCNLTFSLSENFQINDKRPTPMSTNESKRLRAFLQAEQHQRGFVHAITVAIEGGLRTHFGFGSGTAIRLACLEALHRLNGSEPAPTELVAMSGRGGTSGIGIHTYFSGGCVFDLGRPADRCIHEPSHQVVTTPPPLLLDHLPMPKWDIGICIPLNIPHKTQEEERAFFERTCPLPAPAVYETIYHSLFGLYAAIREPNKEAFCMALQAIQNCAWKNAERLEYGAALTEIEQALYSFGAKAVGMSSLGPSLFFLADDVTDVVSRMLTSMPDCECFATRPANHGRKLRND